MSANDCCSRFKVFLSCRFGILDEIFEIEMTLTNRDEMGFRMLLGRESIRKRFLIDTGKSFYATEDKKDLNSKKEKTK